MNSQEQSVIRQLDSQKSTKNKDDSPDETSAADLSHLQGSEPTRKSSNRAPDSSDQSTVSKTPGQADSESEKGSPGAPQTTSNTSKAKFPQPNQDPSQLLIKLQEKANKEFSEEKKRDVSLNAANQLSNIHSLLEGGDIRNRNKNIYSSSVNFNIGSSLLNTSNPEVLLTMLFQNQFNAYSPLSNIPFPNLAEKALASNMGQSQDKLLGNRDSSLQAMLQSQNLAALSSNSLHGNEDNEKDHSKAGRDMDLEDKLLNAGKGTSVHSSESKTNLAKDNSSALLEDSQMDSAKNIKGLAAKKKKSKQCFNKICSADANNLDLWSKTKIRGTPICKQCFEAYKNEQYCYHCQQIYFDYDGAANDDQDWIECESCKHWIHIDCEAQNGQRNIRALLKEKAFKFYCKNCKSDKAKVPSMRDRPVKTSTRNSVGRVTTSTTNPYQRQFGTQRRQAPKTANHAKPPLDDKISVEDFAEEPAPKKVKVIEPQIEAVETDVLRLPSEVVKEPVAPVAKNQDIAKLKLDSMFSRNAKKKSVRHITTTFDNYNDIDKLMSQYAGKKVQLTENEINYDLNLFRELTSYSYGYLDRSMNEYSYGYDQSDKSSSDGKVNGKSKKVRYTEKRKSTKGRGKNFYNESDMFYGIELGIGADF